MYTYLVMYLRYVPTGRFFVPWEWRPADIVLELPKPVSTNDDLRSLKARIAAAICGDTDPKYGKGIRMEHHFAELFLDEANVARGIVIGGLELLTVRPAGA